MGHADWQDASPGRKRHARHTVGKEAARANTGKKAARATQRRKGRGTRDTTYSRKGRDRQHSMLRTRRRTTPRGGRRNPSTAGLQDVTQDVTQEQPFNRFRGLPRADLGRFGRTHARHTRALGAVSKRLVIQTEIKGAAPFGVYSAWQTGGGWRAGSACTCQHTRSINGEWRTSRVRPPRFAPRTPHAGPRYAWGRQRNGGNHPPSAVALPPYYYSLRTGLV